MQETRNGLERLELEPPPEVGQTSRGYIKKYKTAFEPKVAQSWRRCREAFESEMVSADMPTS